LSQLEKDCKLQLTRRSIQQTKVEMHLSVDF
jgi:hypothetical protein